MARTVFHKGNQVGKLADIARLLFNHFIENGADGAHDINIFALVVATDIVGLTALTFGRHFIERAGVIFHIQPVADLFAVAVDRQRFPGEGIEDSQRNEFFREVIRAVVVGAVGHHHRQAVGTVPGANQMVAARFGGGVRAAWRVRRLFGEQVIGTVQVAVDFIGGDMVEAESLLVRRIESRPVVTCRLQQSKGADQVGLNKGSRAINGAVHMTFCGEVHDDIRAKIAELGCHSSSIGDIGLRKRVAFIAGHRCQGFKVASVGQAIYYAYIVGGIFNDMTNNCRTNKTCTAGDKDLHILSLSDSKVI